MADGPLFVFCDTNAAAWDGHLFQKRSGLQLIALLRAKKGKLVVPEVMRGEYVKQYGRTSEDARQKAVVSAQRLQTLCGINLIELIPRDRFWEDRALELLTRLDDVIHAVPTTDALMVAAGQRSINEVPPTSKSDHGFKDCLIWESLMTLPPGSELVFLSRDKTAFFVKQSLAPNLAADAAERGIIISPVIGQDDLLEKAVGMLRERFADFDALMPEEPQLISHPLVTVSRGPANAEPLLPSNKTLESLELPSTDGPRESLDLMLTRALAPLRANDLQALGFVSFLGSTPKGAVTKMLEAIGMNAAEAKNALERLTLAGLIQDTGHHFLAIDSELSRTSAAYAEASVIKASGLGA
jgi:hypothetical protein